MDEMDIVVHIRACTQAHICVLGVGHTLGRNPGYARVGSLGVAAADSC